MSAKLTYFNPAQDTVPTAVQEDHHLTRTNSAITSSCFAKASTDFDVSAPVSSKPPPVPVPLEPATPAAEAEELVPAAADDSLPAEDPSVSSCPSSISPVAKGDGGTVL